ncbi:MAG: hypothetical protein EA381_14720 [Planctomycetaceae bacterium]|nr:MAG: hypothetical protein EA381_14720 [Planctomycetaceae bacterium]
MSPTTISDVLKLLETYHKRRHDLFRRLAKSATDDRAATLLGHLEELEQHTIDALRAEQEGIDPDHSTFLTPGAALTLTSDALAATYDVAEMSFDEALDCALAPNEALEELIGRLENCTAALSVQELAARLRELEHSKDRQIANFSREE